MPYSTTPPPYLSNPSKPALFSAFRARNGGAPDSFLTSDNATTMEATPGGSDTEEEDNSAQEREYLDKMIDDTNRKVETVFGAGLDVWKSFGSTVYADVKDSVKKKRRDEDIWGKKKRTNKGKARARFTEVRKSLPLDDRYRDDEQAEHAANQVSNLPTTLTQSEWEIFLVSDSQYDNVNIPVSFSSALHITPVVYEPSLAPVLQGRSTTHTTTPTFPAEPVKPTTPRPKPYHLLPYRRRIPTDKLSHRGSAGVDPLGNLNRPY